MTDWFARPVKAKRSLNVGHVQDDDPDGNQLFFNYPSETASGKIVGAEA